VDGEDAEDGLLHWPLAPVVSEDELVVLEPFGQIIVPDEIALLLPLLLLSCCVTTVGTVARFTASCSGRRRSHGFLFQARRHSNAFICANPQGREP
jgi:hypothetical protein